MPTSVVIFFNSARRLPQRRNPPLGRRGSR